MNKLDAGSLFPIWWLTGRRSTTLGGAQHVTNPSSQTLSFVRTEKSSLYTPTAALHLSLVALLCPFEFSHVTRTNRARVQTLCDEEMRSNLIGQWFTNERILQSPFLHICLMYHNIVVLLSTFDDRHRPDTRFHGLQATGVMLAPA